MRICYCADENVIHLLNMSAESVLKFNPDAEIIVISKEKLNIKYRNLILNTNNIKFPYTLEYNITETTYYRLFIPTFGFDKCIYLDCDTLCCGSLKELWDTDVPYIGVCHSHNSGISQAKTFFHDYYALDSMMLMNCTNLLLINFFDTILRCLKNLRMPPGMFHFAESALNYSFYDKLTFLPLKWNMCVNRNYNLYKEKFSIENAVIRHYIGGQKKQQYDDFNSLFTKNVKKKRVLIFSNVQYPENKKIETNTDDVLIFLNKATTADYYKDSPAERKIHFRARKNDIAFGHEISWCEHKIAHEGDIPKYMISDMRKNYDWNYISKSNKHRGMTTGYMVVFWAEKIFYDREIFLVNFGYNVNNSTPRRDDHNWRFEDKQLSKYNHIYTCDLSSIKKRLLIETGTNEKDDEITDRIVSDIKNIGYSVNVKSLHPEKWINDARLDTSITKQNCDYYFRECYNSKEKITRENQYRMEAEQAVGIKLIYNKNKDSID